MAGRFADARGAQILRNVSSMDEARQLAEEDPFVKGSFLPTYELREWPMIFNYTVSPPQIIMS